MKNLHPLFRAAFDDLRDGNAALARAAAKGPLKPDGSRMPTKPLTSFDRTFLDELTASVSSKPRSYDPKCHLLAEQFLADHAPFSEAENDALAWAIQSTIENWLFDRETNRLVEEEQP